ncbi:MAG: DNA directed RNA polymerase subunit L, partial [Gaeavirus sp.]
MKGRLSQLPITKLNHQIKYLPQKYYKDINYADPKFERYIEDTYQINYTIRAKNNGPNPVLNVSTNDLEISINNTDTPSEDIGRVKVNTKYSEKYPILLIQLRPGEEFECSMKGVLSIGESDAIFNASNT